MNIFISLCIFAFMIFGCFACFNLVEDMEIKDAVIAAWEKDKIRIDKIYSENELKDKIETEIDTVMLIIFSLGSWISLAVALYIYRDVIKKHDIRND